MVTTGNEGMSEPKKRTEQALEYLSVDVAALCHGPQAAPLSLLAYIRSEAGRGVFSGGRGSR